LYEFFKSNTRLENYSRASSNAFAKPPVFPIPALDNDLDPRMVQQIYDCDWIIFRKVSI